MRLIRRAAHLLLGCLLLASSACATSVSKEVALAKWTPEEDRRAEQQIEGDRSPELLVLLAFSGGGTRAATSLPSTAASTSSTMRPSRISSARALRL
jgi:hypothetical protein